jgi:hypothetical protein
LLLLELKIVDIVEVILQYIERLQYDCIQMYLLTNYKKCLDVEREGLQEVSMASTNPSMT